MSSSNDHVVQPLAVNPFHPNIIMQVLHTIFHMFRKVPKRRICLTIKNLFS